MIYILVIALILTAVGFWLKARRNGAFAAFLDVLISIVFGFLAGILIGAGARVGMWAIVFANGAESSFSFSGTARVIATFACFGIAFGLIYEGILRPLLRRSGLIYGILITLVALYPVGKGAAQDLNFQPTTVSLFLWSGVCLALMFVPFGVVLEMLLKRWHKREIESQVPSLKPQV